MNVARFLARRLVTLAALLVVLSFIVFSLLYVAPGDIVKNLLGTRPAAPETVAAIRARYHLDDPFLVQYWKWLGNALTGDLGESVRTSVPVTQMFGDRIGVTLLLTGLAALLALGFGVPLGIRAAQRHGSAVDRGIVATSIVGISAPGFAVGLLLLYVFAVMLGWFPLYGLGEPGLDRLWHLALPAVALALGVGAIVVKITRTAVLRELSEDYVAFARSRGLAPSAVRSMYLRGAATPIVTSTGLVLAGLFGGSVLVETTFALPGLGVLLADSITFKDLPVVQALTLVIATFIGVTTALVDLFAVLVDPRVRRARVAS
ncbi:ABC transporter permease [Sanguibacter hominis ATCC BAA-789]|uniref:ABC transporter permease n=1 Tax=Sanguibacter hominis ATCC BAA-789 TaxID=1312740 RepID=A0A9X5IRD4_9MICO|nr:ABC transporter permease [Sanguibacter hominis]NKX92658.1 ABC transporter permease [Sanguibacter hominis ATCC BAA-789]